MHITLRPDLVQKSEINRAVPLGMLIVECLHHPIKMRSSSKNHQDMKYLMRGAPDVERPRTRTFWEPRGIEASSEDIQDALEHDPVKRDGLS